MRIRGAAAAAAVIVIGVAGCGGSSGSSSGADSPSALLRAAKTTIDATPALHFVLTTSGVSGSVAILGGEGDLARPSELKGTFQATFDGFQADVPVAASGSTFLAKLPTSSSYEPLDPSSFGLANPTRLISPNGGLSDILIEVSDPTSTGRTRLDGDVVDEIKGTVPGRDLTFLPDRDPAEPVGVVADIDTSNHQLRQISLTGPIATTSQATYTVTLTDYGEHVDLALPGS